MANANGTVSLTVNMSDQIPAGAHQLAAVNVPVQPGMAPGSAQWGTGTIANSVTKSAVVVGTAAAAVVDTDLTAIVCTDGTTGFMHIRQIFLYNDSLPANPTNTLTTGLGTNPFAPYLGGTTPSIEVEAGGVFLAIKPNGPAGWPVTSGAKVVRADPGANTVPFRLVVFGD